MLFGVYTQLPAVGLLHNTVPFVGCVGVTLVGSSGAPVDESLAITFVVTAVFCGVVLLSGLAVTTSAPIVIVTIAVLHSALFGAASHTVYVNVSVPL